MRNDRSKTGSVERSKTSKKEIPSYKNGKRPPILPHILIIALVTLAAIVVTIFLGNRAYQGNKQMVLEQFDRQQLILARSAAVGIEAYFSEIGTAMLSAVKMPAIQRVTPDCLEYMEYVYTNFLPRTSIRRLDERGVLRFIYPSEGWREKLVGRNYRKEACFQRARDTGRAAVSGVIINEQGDMRIRVVVPVYLDEGRFNGVLAVSFDPDVFAEAFIYPIVSGETGYAWLINQDGVFLAHYEDKFVGRDAFKARAEKNPDLSYEAINRIQRKMMAGEEGVSHYISGWHREQKGKIEKLIAYAPVHALDKVWSVAVCAPASEVKRIMSKVNRSHLYILGFVILILTAAGVSFFIVFYRWAQSLQREIKIRKQAEERIIHLNAVLRAIRNVNQLITKEKDREKLLQGACDNLIETRGYDSAWIALIEEDGGFVTVARAGVDKDFSKIVDRSESGELTQCISQAIWQPGIVVVADPVVGCDDCPMVGTCTGKARAIARLEYEGRVYGFLSVTVPIEMAADKEERLLFGEVAEDIAFALHNIDVEANRKQAEDALRENEKRFRDIAFSMADWIWEVDEKGVYTYCSEQARKILGYSVDEIIGKTPLDLMPPEEAERVAEIFKEILAQKKPIKDLENLNVTKDGRKIWLITNGVPMLDANGNVTGYRGVNKDITEKKQIDEQLIRADRLASLGQLSGGIAHEIRNPLAGISLFLDILGYKEKFDQTDSELEILDEIRDNVNKIDGIIRRILDFAKPTIRASAKIDINAVVREEIKFWSAKIRNSEIDLQLSLEDDIPPVLGDPIELRQVWNNLVQNALDVMGKGGTLSITTVKGMSSFHKDRRVVVIRVKDTGPGIKPEHRGNLFNPFFTTKATGTGLGLAISHQIIERHGGTISFESELDKETTFTVELPVIEETK